MQTLWARKAENGKALGFRSTRKPRLHQIQTNRKSARMAYAFERTRATAASTGGEGQGGGRERGARGHGRSARCFEAEKRRRPGPSVVLVCQIGKVFISTFKRASPLLSSLRTNGEARIPFCVGRTSAVVEIYLCRRWISAVGDISPKDR